MNATIKVVKLGSTYKQCNLQLYKFLQFYHNCLYKNYQIESTVFANSEIVRNTHRNTHFFLLVLVSVFFQQYKWRELSSITYKVFRGIV